MRIDIHKLGVWLEARCQEGVAIEHKILEWKLAEEKELTPARPRQEAKVS